MITSGHEDTQTKILKMITHSLNFPQYNEKSYFTGDEINKFIDFMFGYNLYSIYGLEDNEDIKQQIRANIQTHLGEQIIDGTVSLHDGENHQPWLNEQKPNIPWKLWDCYRNWLKKSHGRSPNVLAALENSVDETIDALENPTREGAWERKGLMLGHIQSGKTQHYIGVVNKAIDAGYKIIIILTGMTNDLRSQTQIRFDEGVYGFESDEEVKTNKNTNNYIGAHALSYCLYKNDHDIHVLTTRSHKGDFSKLTSGKFPGPLHDDPYILVVKKNKSVLKNLSTWLQGKTPDGQSRIAKPVLIIDDEADQASINTNKIEADKDLTAINKGIREILDLFSRKAFVAYTATCFANVLIRFKDNEGDLFPKHFILQTPTPSSYVGPDRIFGLRSDPDIDSEPEEGWGPCGVIRHILDKDHYGQITKDTMISSELPPSMKEAIQSFLLSCAVRNLRGQEKQHKSMLIHVTQNTWPQTQLMEHVNLYKTEIGNVLKFGDSDGNIDTLTQLESLWKNDYEKTIEWNADKQQPEYSTFEMPTWGKIKSQLLNVTESIRVREVNGNSKDALMYKDFPDGLNVIVVGGNKLSRGLTLEGLSVSYFLRSAKAGDTLLQMGRWFGYKPGYLDLCRVYTDPSLHEDYVTLANQEVKIREKLDTMSRQGRSPLDFCIALDKDPNNRLTLTALNKMHNAITLKSSYSGVRAWQNVYSREKDDIDQNYSTLLKLIKSTTNKTKPGNNKVLYQSISGDNIITFLEELKLPLHRHQIQTSTLIQYIKNRISVNELNDWTVALIGGNRSQRQINGDSFTLAHRADKTTNEPTYRIQTLVSNPDELLDLSSEKREQVFSKAYNEAMNAWQKKIDAGTANGSKKPGQTEAYGFTGHVVRGELGTEDNICRHRNNGMLMVYLVDPKSAKAANTENPVAAWCISFPTSEDDTPIQEIINKDHADLLSDYYDDDDE